MQHRTAEVRQSLAECYKENEALKLVRDDIGNIKSDYNIAFDQNWFSLKIILDRSKDIVITIGKCMKVVLQLGTKLFNNQSEQFHLFAPHINEVFTEQATATCKANNNI